jgi:hypothetical protein
MSDKLREALAGQLRFLERHLETLVHVPCKDECGHVVNGFAAAQIPDWAMRQQIDDLRAALAAPTPAPATRLRQLVDKLLHTPRTPVNPSSMFPYKPLPCSETCLRCEFEAALATPEQATALEGKDFRGEPDHEKTGAIAIGERGKIK